MAYFRNPLDHHPYKTHIRKLIKIKVNLEQRQTTGGTQMEVSSEQERLMDEAASLIDQAVKLLEAYKE